MSKRYYIEVRPETSDNWFYFSSTSKENLEACQRDIEKFMSVSSERNYRETLHDLELNGVTYHSPWFDDKPIGECILTIDMQN